MTDNDKTHHSLYALLGAIIIGVVILVLIANAAITYYVEKEKILSNMQEETELTISRLQQNLASFIEAYAIAEYESLITTEAMVHHHLAIVVSNFQMGRLLGQPAYISGKIRDASGELIDFDPNNTQHQQWLDKASRSRSTIIVTDDGRKLGRVTIYSSGERLKSQLNSILMGTLNSTLLILALLVSLLLLSIHRLVVRPLANVTRAMSSHGSDGIPIKRIPDLPYRELYPLTDTMNRMLHVIRESNESIELEKTRLHNVIKGTGAGTWEWDVASGKLIINEQWARMIGYTLDELTPADYTTWSSRLHPDDLERSQKLLEQHFAGELAEYRSEIRMRHKNGHWVWILALGQLSLRDSSGKPILMSGTHIDISELKNQELEIMQQRQRLNDILIGTNTGTWEWNVQTGEVNFNERWASMIGYHLDELEPVSINTWTRLVHPDDLEKSNELLQKHFSGELAYYECEARMRHKDGHWVWVLDRGRISTYTEDGQPLLMAGTHQDITEIKEYQQKLEQVAHFDPLTHLPNRILFADRLHQAMVMAQRHDKKLAIIYLDLDGFKSVNDNYGHETGDRLLSAVSVRMKEALREGDTLARIGGDEFVGVLLDLTDDEALPLILERLLGAASEPIRIDGHSIQVSASIGISFYPQKEDVDDKELLRQADEAMYLAKNDGKNRYRIAEVTTQFIN